MIDLTGRVALVTGSGAGLGKQHALLLAQRGARVAINDLNLDSAQAVSDEITTAGGQAMAIAASVSDFGAIQAMADDVLGQWGRIDILINNAGILRDKSFGKMDLEDFRLVLDVHLMGAVNCTKAVWNHMRECNYGRIVMTTSSSRLYGNFGQSNYGAAKLALVGLMQTLSIEGARNNIRVNCIAPTAATAMTDGLLPEAEFDLLRPELVSPGVLTLVREDAPTRMILCAGAGAFESANVTLTQGIFLGAGSDMPERVLENWDAIVDRTDEVVPQSGLHQGDFELNHAGLSREGA